MESFVINHSQLHICVAFLKPMFDIFPSDASTQQVTGTSHDLILGLRLSTQTSEHLRGPTEQLLCHI